MPSAASAVPISEVASVPHAAVKELGGTGRTHDWDTSRRIRDAVWPLPLYLAGGLRADNVAQAIATVRPHGLDLCSSVRQQGALHGQRLTDFFAAVHAASPATGLTSTH